MVAVRPDRALRSAHGSLRTSKPRRRGAAAGEDDARKPRPDDRPRNSGGCRAGLRTARRGPEAAARSTRVRGLRGDADETAVATSTRECAAVRSARDARRDGWAHARNLVAQFFL